MPGGLTARGLEAAVDPAMDPGPILDRFEAYRGRIHDLDTGLSVDGDGLRRLRDQACRGLTAAGLLPGDRVVFCIANGPLFTAALAAVLAAGGSPIMTHPGATPAERARVAQSWEAAWIMTDPWTRGEEPDGWLACGEDTGLGLRRLAAAPRLRLVGVPLHQTSGTTGTPKLALRPAAAAIAEAIHYADAMQVTAADRILCVTPMSHAYSYGMGAMLPLVSGAELATMRAFNPRLVSRALAEAPISVFAAVPAMLPVLLRGFCSQAPALRMLTSGGELLRADLADSFQAATGVEARPLFGATETGCIALGVGEVRHGAIGPVLAGVETRLAPFVIAAEGVGILEVRSPSMMAGYLTPDGVTTGRDADGWFATGDLARIAPDGKLELLGRVGDVINVMGNKVVPSEVEAVLALMPEVAEVKVYAGAHHGGSDMVVAAIVADGTLTEAMIRRHCDAQLVAYKRPTQIHLLDAMPRATSGKIRARDLPQGRQPVMAEI